APGRHKGLITARSRVRHWTSAFASMYPRSRTLAYRGRTGTPSRVNPSPSRIFEVTYGLSAPALAPALEHPAHNVGAAPSPARHSQISQFSRGANEQRLAHDHERCGGSD